jgi:hypothetical protein
MNGFTESKLISAIAGVVATEGNRREVESLPLVLRNRRGRMGEAERQAPC